MTKLSERKLKFDMSFELDTSATAFTFNEARL
jgi:hypothetical protein